MRPLPMADAPQPEGRGKTTICQNSVDLADVMLSEISQMEKDKDHVISLTRGIRTRKSNKGTNS